MSYIKIYIYVCIYIYLSICLHLLVYVVRHEICQSMYYTHIIQYIMMCIYIDIFTILM